MQSSQNSGTSLGFSMVIEIILAVHEESEDGTLENICERIRAETLANFLRQLCDFALPLSTRFGQCY